MEYCPGGTLTALAESRELSPAEVVVLHSQCCAAIAHLHALQPPVIHRDVKLENFLLSASGEVKLCDFGSVTEKSVVTCELTFAQIAAAEEEMNMNTTPQNRSPEMLDMHSGKVVGKAGDVWALGCGLFQLCFRKHPFEDAAKLAIINGKFRVPPNSKHEALVPVITQLLNTNPDDRPSARAAADLLREAGVGGVDLVDPMQFLPSTASSMASSANPSRQSSREGSRKSSRQTSPKSTGDQAAGGGDSGGSAGSSRSGSARSFLGSLGSGAVSIAAKAREGARGAVKAAVAKVAGAGGVETNRHGGPAGDLDLTYICPRLLAIAAPTNPAELAAYLQSAHPQQCLVVDIATDPRRQLDPAAFPGVVIEQIKWPQGLCVPLKKLFLICEVIHRWLLKHKTNVAAVHCSNGKEDTGTVIASYLVYSRLCSAADATRLFHLKRIFEGKRVITASQQIYVGYIGRIVSGRPPHSRAITIGQVVMESVPMFNTRGNGCKPYLEVYQSGKLVKRAPDPAASEPCLNEPGKSIVIDVDAEVVGDVMIVA